MDVIETLRKHRNEIKARYSVTIEMMNPFTAESPEILLAQLHSAVSKYGNRKCIWSKG